MGRVAVWGELLYGESMDKEVSCGSFGIVTFDVGINLCSLRMFSER